VRALRAGNLAAVLVLAGSLAGCASRTAAPPGPPTPTPSATPAAANVVVLRDFSIEPRMIKAKAGPARFQVTNRGAVDHDFQIPAIEEHHGHEQHMLNPGQSKTFAYDLKPGTYDVVCTIPGHREAGMAATLVVAP
jgi:uncharacterized cupredoxin-like copper-binding protein